MLIRLNDCERLDLPNYRNASNILCQFSRFSGEREKDVPAEDRFLLAIFQGSSLPPLPLRRVLLTAVWFALLTGLVEGISLLGIFGYGWLNVGIRHGVSAQIIGISVAWDLVIYLTFAVGVLAVARLFPRSPILPLAFAIFTFLTFFDWMALPFRLHTASIALLACGVAVTLYRYLHDRDVQAWTLVRTSLLVLIVTTALIIGGVVGSGWWRHEKALSMLPAASPNSPNILVLVIDTLRADHLNVYGYERPTSPHLAEIANQGIVFDNAISPASWTLPAHASLLTGLLPHEHGADGEDPLDTRHRTLGEVLQSRGYRTAGFSGNSLYFTRRAGLARGFLDFDDYFYSPADMVSRTVWGRKFGAHLANMLGRKEWPERQRAAEINQRALHWIDKDPNRPFLLFLNYFDLHTPRVPPQPYRSRFARVNVGGWVLPDSGYPLLTREQQLADTDAYDAAIAYDDEQTGHLISELKARGLDKNTLVVITADHGESLGEHGILRHRNDLYRELIQVPLIFWWPGRLPTGKRIEVPVSTARLGTTLLDLIGQPDQRDFGGKSLAELWRNPASAANWPLPVAELTRNPYAPPNYPTHYGDLESIVAPDWQLIITQKRPPELFRWTSDPREQQNVASAPELRGVFQQLSSLLWDQLSSPTSHVAVNHIAH